MRRLNFVNGQNQTRCDVEVLVPSTQKLQILSREVRPLERYSLEILLMKFVIASITFSG